MNRLSRLIRKACRMQFVMVGAFGVSMLLPMLATAATFNVPATFADIQNAINGANPGDIINVAAGTVTLSAAADIISVLSTKVGIKLIGAGVGQTIIEKAAGTSSQPILRIGNSTSCTGASGATVVEGFTFRNSGGSSGAQRAIEIRSCGNSAGDPAIIRDSEFLGFRDTGIGIVDFPYNYWEIYGNIFDGSRLAIWINQADFVTITDNVFMNYVVAVGFDANDVVTDLTITNNKMLGGSYDPTPQAYYGLFVSSASTVAGASKNWDISDNTITGATRGIRVNAPTSTSLFQSLKDVSVYENCIFDNNVLGLASVTPHGIENLSPETLDAKNNWWGDASGPFHGIQSQGPIRVTFPAIPSSNTQLVDGILS